MLLGFKTELKLNNKQRTMLAKHAGVARHAFNWGLGLTKQILLHNRDKPEEKIKFPSAIDLHKWLVAMVKPQYPWYYESSKCAPQYAPTVYTQVKVNYLKEDRKHLRKDGEPNFNSRRTIPRKNIWRPQIG